MANEEGKWMIIILGDYILEINADKNKAYYKDYVYGCDCDACVNYKSSVKDVLPDEAALFDEMGLDISKPVEVYEMGSKDNVLFYGGWYHICGKLIKGDSKSATDYFITENYRISFQKECVLLGDNFPDPCFQMRIEARLPWSLKKDNVYEKLL